MRGHMKGHMRTVARQRRGAALLLLAAAALAHAQPDGKRWIHGSWVNVRASAAADGPVVDHLITNTPVELRAENGKSCEIGWTRDGREANGFVACRLLGDKPLTSADLGTPTLPDGQPNPQYLAARAFWMAPSMANLFLAGDHFAATLLPPAQRQLEQGRGDNPSDKAPRLVRYPVPEFDAMKAVLAKGVIAPGGADPLSESCDDILPAQAQPARKDDALDVDTWRAAPPQCRLPRMALRLPAVRQSLFKRGDRLLPATATIEDIGARFGIVERGRAVGQPKWEFDRYEDRWRYTGAWDIGAYELTLDKPVVEHVVGRTGLVGAYQWTPQERVTPNGIQDGCASGMSEDRRGKTLLANYPDIHDELLWFHAPQALPYRTAKIKTHVERGPKPAKDETNPIKRVAVYEIDLNGDGIPDFVHWEIWDAGALYGNDPVVSRWEQYVNVAGRWYPFAWNYYVECT